MTPEQALKVLDDTCAQVSASRIGHATLAQAVQTLQMAIRPKEQDEKNGDGHGQKDESKDESQAREDGT